MNSNPFTKANFLSKVTFWWLIPFLGKGHQKGIKESDLYECVSTDSAEILGDKLEKEWNSELDTFKSGHCPSLSKAIVRQFGRDYVLVSVLPLLEECVLKILQALSLGILVRCFTSSEPEPDKYFQGRLTRTQLTYVSSAGVCLTTVLCQFTRHPYFIQALKLSKAALGETTVGQLVNLVSNDVGRFDQAVLYLPYLIIGPLQVTIVVLILWEDLKYTALIAVSLLLVYIPYQGWIGKLFSKLRGKTAVITDERIRIMSEVIGSIKIIKMYTWENYFTNLIQQSRRKEVAKIRHSSILQSLNVAFSLVFSKIILVICFVLYTVVLNGTLTAEVVFVTMTLFNNLRLCMTFSFANAVSQLAESRSSILRLQAFMLLEEQEEMDTVERPMSRPILQDCRVLMKNVSARWDYICGDMTLNAISVEANPGDLLAVVGPVGSGKSSLLMTLLGELQAVKGKVIVKGKVAYSSQEAWTFAGTIRQNILFGNTYDMEKYKRILYACALDKDVNDMPRGDLTMVGDRGISLSGGQRARVNLARTLYSDADIYLLDDPLSAVDAAVAKHLFEKCINGYLGNKIRILVTHQVQFLRPANQILVLDNGSQQGLGDFTALLKSGINFVSMSEDIVQETQRRQSILSSPVLNARRKSLVQGINRSKPGQSGQQISTRRKSIMMTGRRKSTVKELGVMNTIAESNNIEKGSYNQERKKSFVATLFGTEARMSFKGRSKSIKEKRDSIMSNSSAIFAEEMIGKTTSEVSPFGAMYECNYPEFDDEIETENTEAVGFDTAVGWEIYWKYLRSGATSFYLLTFFTITLLTQLGVNGSDFWVTLWTNSNQCHLTDPNITVEAMNCSKQVVTLSRRLYDWDIWYENIFRDGYAALVAAVLVLSLIRSVMFSLLSMSASVKLHDDMYNSVSNSQLAFFDNNPVGRILNRFSRDIGAIDDLLPVTFFDVLSILLSLSGNVILVIIVNPWIAIPTVFIFLIFAYLRGYFVRTTRDVKRIESITRSPIYSCLTTSLMGLTTIRAFGARAKLEKEFYTAQDKHTSAWFAFIAVSQAFGMVLDFVCAIYISVITVVLVCLSDTIRTIEVATSSDVKPLSVITYASATFLNTTDIPGGNIGLAISSALVLSGTFQWGVRLSVEVENQMTSVERVLEYSDLKPESGPETDQKPPPEWPNAGKIDFNEVYLRYTPDGKPILRDFACSITAMEKVGIVGRTGAGKSSLIAALFRMVEPEGLITLDGLDIKGIGLKDLRSKISIIPQEPLIFSASVRKNLDPFDQYSDTDVWSVLEEVKLKDMIQKLPDGLNTELTTEGGGNLSVGQRQLFCLARTILKRNRVLVMDEATASIDHKTDSLIQKLIDENFRNCTILTIAHRLNTIINYDKILVLDNGKAAEFDEPYVLLQKEQGIFVEMVQQTGPASAQNLRDLALVAFNKRHYYKSPLKFDHAINSITEEDPEPNNTPTIVGSSFKNKAENTDLETKL